MVVVNESSLTFVPLHKTFGAEVRGIDFSKQPVEPEIVDEVRQALGKYGVLVFRKTNLSDDDYCNFLANFGEIDLQRGPPNPRIPDRRMGDPSNIKADGSIVQKGELQYYLGKATTLFHVDSPYDARRIRFTSIKAVIVVPPGTGGSTEFADSRTAYDELDQEMKDFLEDKVGCFSIFQSRKISDPDFPTWQALEPEKYYMGKHKIVQTNPLSGRKDLYIASHLHHIEGMDPKESWALIEKLKSHTTQKKNVLSIFYENPTDFSLWDNLSVLHRATGGDYVGKFPRDVRRVTSYDNTENEWGFNSRDDPRLDPMVIINELHEKVLGKNELITDYD